MSNIWTCKSFLNFEQILLLSSQSCSIQLVIAMSRTVQLYNISRAMRSQSDYAKKIKYLSASIFGEVRRPQLEKDAKTKALVQVQTWLCHYFKKFITNGGGWMLVTLNVTSNLIFPSLLGLEPSAIRNPQGLGRVLPGPRWNCWTDEATEELRTLQVSLRTFNAG